MKRSGPAGRVDKRKKMEDGAEGADTASEQAGRENKALSSVPGLKKASSAAKGGAKKMTQRGA